MSAQVSGAFSCFLQSQCCVVLYRNVCFVVLQSHLFAIFETVWFGASDSWYELYELI